MASISINKKVLVLVATVLAMFSYPVFAGWGATATEADPAYTNLTTNAQRGRWVWLKYNCAGCHGDRAAGGMAPNIQDKQQGNIKDAVTGGTSAMPPSFKSVTPNDILMLTAYLKSLNKAGEPMFICWWKYPINDLNYSGSGTRPNCNP